uniref:Werner Syndrome-like exonuclease n=1 Tax=Erigeron canadensis TaxID=72917 RepID=UPI001CB8BBC1|nr:Werner Syndrome-like exonuclease [Erigeron canadensis]
MSIGMYDHAYYTHDEYNVKFYNDTILTLVTKSPNLVDEWISKIEHIHRRHLHRLVVGLDVEWRPNPTEDVKNPVATLQLCVGRRCLVFQILHSSHIPESLVNFLRNPNYRFTGVGIWDVVFKLSNDYNLCVWKVADLRELAAEVYDVHELNHAGLEDLTEWALDKEIYKPKTITMSNWDEECLSPDQVQYACLDAFLSFEIGRILIKGDYSF